ncbi:PaaX family transcriptional regulator [Leucobacter sp. USHLN153]|uniref:PaaX family transcriptional regulator n=1 Tax=Leucobacter sp. USHLN153 TaxID=3081268 RepID=UPI0030187F80
MTPNTSRTLLVTLLGAFARRVGDWLPVKVIVALLEELGVDESSARTGVSRLKKRGWLEPEKRGSVTGYRLTDLARDTLASGDEYIWHSRQPADLADGWCIATFSVPEDQRAHRHLLRSRLASLGFGNVGQGVWIAPARMAPSALDLVTRLDLASNTILLVGDRVGGQELSQLAREAWDLDAIDAGYRAFLARHEPGFAALRDGGALPSPRTAYTHYVRALNDWRVLPMRDPALPRELLPSDWAGEPATRLIEEIVTRLDEPAFAHVRAELAR